MLSFPSIPISYGPWQIECYGLAPKLTRSIIIEIVRQVLFHQRIKKRNVIVEIFLKNEMEMAILHKQWLDKDGATDTISLPINDDFENIAPTLFGSIMLCLPVIKKNAIDQNKVFFEHLSFVVVHSMLHLFGYDHIEDADANMMEIKEKVILMKLGVKYS
jgi:probable rRNA maturation factor